MEPGSHTLEWQKGETMTHTKTVSVPVGTHTARWTATHDAGTVATTMQVIVVQDTRPPTLTISKGVRFTIEATSTNTDLSKSTDSGVGAPTNNEASLPVDLFTPRGTLPVPEKAEFETVAWRGGRSRQRLHGTH